MVWGRAVDIKLHYMNISSSAIAERTSCRVRKFRPKVEDWNWETIFTDIIGLSSTTAT